MVVAALLLAEVKTDWPVFAYRECLLGPIATPDGGIWMQLQYEREQAVVESRSSTTTNQSVFQNAGRHSIETGEGRDGGVSCRIVKWDATYQERGAGLEMRWKKWWYVAPDGTLLRTYDEATAMRKRVISPTIRATTVYGPDGATVQREEGQKRQSFEVPYGDWEARVEALFRPMLADGEVKTSEKRTAWYCPVRQRWTEATFRHRGTFGGLWDGKRVRGQSFDVETPEGTLSTYLLQDGRVFDVRVARYLRYIPESTR